MDGKTKAVLVFIPSPGRGHLLSTVELAKLLVHRDHRLSITILVIKPFDEPKYTPNVDPTSTIRFVDLPKVEPHSEPFPDFISFYTHFINSHKTHVRNEVSKIVNGLDTNSKLAGFVVDMFCTGMIDVANDLGVPSYMFFTSGAAVLGVMLHFQGMLDYENRDLAAELGDSNNEIPIPIPSLESPIPAKLLHPNLFDKDGGSNRFMDLSREIRATKGIIINTFSELDVPAMKFFSEDGKIPPVYPVGPILHVDSGDDRNPKYVEIMKWLDEQPDSSVVFLCFGSKGCFDEIQVKEIAVALENSGERFLWSLRKPPGENKREAPGEYEDPGEVLPEGFIERMSGRGKVIGWATQVAVLSHRAVGGFVSHCGWNSTLESLWCGVPMGVWPLFAEQPMNAFQVVRELGVGVEIKMEYQKKASDGGASVTVGAGEIENGIRRLMEQESEIRVKMEALKVKSRMAVVENGSSFQFVGKLIKDVMDNVA